MQFAVSEQEYLRLSRGSQQSSADNNPQPNFRISLTLADGSAYPYRGQFAEYDRTLGNDTGTLTIRTIFKNPYSLLVPGMYARVEIDGLRIPNAMLVPERALHSRGLDESARRYAFGNMAKFFIHRPVFAIVIAIIISLIGIIAGLGTPIAQYPNISPPTINVSTFYSGANASETVAQVIENRVNGTQGMDYMSSNSNDDGSYSLDFFLKSAPTAI